MSYIPALPMCVDFVFVLVIQSLCISYAFHICVMTNIKIKNMLLTNFVWFHGLHVKIGDLDLAAIVW